MQTIKFKRKSQEEDKAIDVKKDGCFQSGAIKNDTVKINGEEKCLEILLKNENYYLDQLFKFYLNGNEDYKRSIERVHAINESIQLILEHFDLKLDRKFIKK